MKKSKTYSERIKQLQKALDAPLMVDHPIDLFYLTGLQMSRGYLIVKKKSARLFVDRRYLEAATKDALVPVESLDGRVPFLKGEKTLQFDGSRVLYSVFEEYKKMARKAKVKLSSNTVAVANLRMVKGRGEILKMKKSAELAYKGFQYASKRLKVGVTEEEIARDLEIYCLKHGAEGMSFEPIIAFGKNSALPHHHPGKTKLRANDVALFDLGVILDGYCSDMTRVVFVGKGIREVHHLYEVTRAAQKVALAKCKPGVALKELDIAARRVMCSAELEELYVHNLGHGVGLEIHEAPGIGHKHPDKNLKLQEGMVITIEPGLYLPGKGGVRYEDTIGITAKGYTNFYPDS